MNKLAAWLIIVPMWTLLIAFGVVCALALPLNLLLVPCWLACAGSVGRLAEELLDKKPAAAPVEAAVPAPVSRKLAVATS